MDRGSMASGVEVWSPFLDLDVVETALRIPGSVRRRLFLGKRPLRRMLATRLPPAVLRRRKRGFGVPLASWLGSGPYAGFARKVLGDMTAPFEGLLPEGRALPLLDRLQRGEAHLAPLVHACIVLALFHDTFLRGTP
jgi:asparagine synthase (glutamine-hydrolysing)